VYLRLCGHSRLLQASTEERAGKVFTAKLLPSPWLGRQVGITSTATHPIQTKFSTPMILMTPFPQSPRWTHGASALSDVRKPLTLLSPRLQTGMFKPTTTSRASLLEHHSNRSVVIIHSHRATDRMALAYNVLPVLRGGKLKPATLPSGTDLVMMATATRKSICRTAILLPCQMATLVLPSQCQC